MKLEIILNEVSMGMAKSGKNKAKKQSYMRYNLRLRDIGANVTGDVGDGGEGEGYDFVSVYLDERLVKRKDGVYGLIGEVMVCKVGRYIVMLANSCSFPRSFWRDVEFRVYIERCRVHGLDWEMCVGLVEKVDGCYYGEAEVVREGGRYICKIRLYLVSFVSDIVLKGTIVHEFLHILFMLHNEGKMGVDELKNALLMLALEGLGNLISLYRDDELIVSLLEPIVMQVLYPSVLQEGREWSARATLTIKDSDIACADSVLIAFCSELNKEKGVGEGEG